MKFQDIISSIDNKVYHPVYFLTGEEAYYIDKISDYISENVLGTQEKEFNQSILYGKETDIAQIITEAKQFPFGSMHRVVIVKEAQQLKNIELLDHYLDNPQTSTVLVISYKGKSIDKRKVFKIIKHLICQTNKMYRGARVTTANQPNRASSPNWS